MGMNKKYVAGGVLLLVLLAGYAGMHVLEKNIESNVAASLAEAKVQAGEIHYSFPSNTLVVGNLTYARPEEDGSVSRGSIDRVELKGLNRKMLIPWWKFSDTEELPLVLESLVFTGMRDSMQAGDARIEQKVAEVRVTGWYQRMRELLEEHRRRPHSPFFYEELYRCRLDGMEISNLQVDVYEPGRTTPSTLSLEKVALSQGIAAPRGEEKVPPVSLYLAGLRLSVPECSALFRRVEVRDLLLPEPHIMAEMVGIVRDALAEDTSSQKGTRTGQPLTAYETRLMAMSDRLVEYYRKNLPYAAFELKGAELTARTAGGDFPIRLDALTQRQSMEEGGVVRAVTDLSRFHFKLPDLKNDVVALISRYAPDGFDLSAHADLRTSDHAVSGTWNYETDPLFHVKGDFALKGDIAALSTFSLSGDDAARSAFLRKLQVEKLNVTYKDSGMLALVVELFAHKYGMKPEECAVLGIQMVGGLAASTQDRLAIEAAALAGEQLQTPGEVQVSFVPAKPTSVMDAVETILANPGASELRLASRPGTKPLKAYWSGR